MTAHAFVSFTDIMLMNGMVRCWPSLPATDDPGQKAALNIEVFAGIWHDAGYVEMGGDIDEDFELMGGRLLVVTPDRSTMALALAGYGEIVFTVLRGERIIRVAHGPGPNLLRTLNWFDRPRTGYASSYATGRAVETTAGPSGFKRVVMGLDEDIDAYGTGLQGTGTSLSYGLGFFGAGETAAGLHEQFCSLNEQQLRVR